MKIKIRGFMGISAAKLIQLPKINDSRGNLIFVESINHIPFDIKRIYYLNNVPYEEKRGGHAHKKLEQVIIAINGSFEIILNNGYNSKTFSLNNPNHGLYIPAMLWRELTNFSENAICLVLASHYYDKSDYIRDYNQFFKLIKKQLTNKKQTL